MAKFVNIDRESPMLLPYDIRDWVPNDHIVHFILEAVDMVGLNSFKINHKGTGSKQYPPQMMLALLIYCYASGRFSSRIIEELVKKAEEADCSNNDNGLSIPEEIKRRVGKNLSLLQRLRKEKNSTILPILKAKL